MPTRGAVTLMTKPNPATELSILQATDALVVALGYTFTDDTLLHQALTHRSLHNERPKIAPAHNERLEFLGDAFIGATVARLLFDTFPDAREGVLTRRRAELVSEAGLERVAIDLGVGGALRLGKGEEKSGGRHKPRLLASAFEALVGAVLLDGGEDAARGLCERVFGPRLHAAKGARDDKSTVQERLQAEGRATPRYDVIDATGPDHERVFTVALMLDGEGGEERFATGQGRSKAEAAQSAARAAIERLDAEAAAG